MTGKDEKADKADTQAERILDAAMEVVTEQTIAGTRMRLIAERAGMVTSNVHYYYKTKEELMLALQERVHRHFAEYRREALARAADTLEERLQALFEQKMDIILKQPAYDYVQTDFWLQSRVDGRIKKNRVKSYMAWRQDVIDILERHRPGMRRKDVDTLAFLIVAMMEGAAMQYLVDKESIDLVAYFKACGQLVRERLAQSHD